MPHMVGGPCDGIYVFPGAPLTLDCSGITYRRRADGNYYPPGATGGAAGTTALGSHAPKGWHDLQKAVNRHLPTALSHASRLRRATMRELTRQARRR